MQWYEKGEILGEMAYRRTQDIVNRELSESLAKESSQEKGNGFLDNSLFIIAKS